MNQLLARGFIVSGIVLLLLGLAFLLQLDFVRYVWPWQISPLSAIFLASICAAIACPIIWIGVTQDTAVITGGSIDLLVTSLGMAIFCFQLYTADNSRQPILLFGIVSAVFAVVCLVLTFVSYKFPFKDGAPYADFRAILLYVFRACLAPCRHCPRAENSEYFPLASQRRTQRDVWLDIFGGDVLFPLRGL